MRRQRRGILLVVVLLTATLLALLVGALFELNGNNLGFLSAAGSGSQAEQCCYSGLDYARARLQGEPGWGTAAWGGASNTVNVPGTLRVSEAGATVAANLASGTLPEVGDFEVHVLNNLDGAASQPAPGWGRRGVEVPVGTALVAIDGKAGGTRRRMEVLVQRGGLSKAVLQAGGDLAVTVGPAGGGARFEAATGQSVVRSSGATLLPAVTSMNFGATAGKGAVYAGGDINAGGTAALDPTTGQVLSVSGGSSLNDAAARAAAQLATNANFYPGQGSNLAALDADQLQAPSTTARTLPAGKWVFRAPDRADYYSSLTANPSSDAPTRSYAGRVYSGGAATGTSGSEAAILEGYRLLPQGKVEVAGALQLESSVAGRSAGLGLGYENSGEFNSRSATSSYFRVAGNVTVQGDLAGRGTLIAEGTAGSGAVTVMGHSDLSSAPNQEVAVHASGPIQFKPVDPAGISAPDTFFASDFEMFGRALVGPQSLSSPAMGTSVQGFMDGSDQPLRTGDNDWLVVPGGDTTLRDAVFTGDFQSAVLSKIPNFSAGMTPGGRTLTAQQSQAVSDYLTLLQTGGPAPPSEPLHPISSGVSVGRYLRLREYLKSIDAGTANPNLLDLANDSVAHDMAPLLVQQMQAFVLDARRAGLASLSAYFSAPNPYAASQFQDMSFVGLLYSKMSLFVTGQRDFSMRGIMGTQSGHITVSGIRQGEFKSDPRLLDRVLDLRKVKLVIAQFWISG